MVKIIWNKDEVDDIRLKLEKDFDLVLTDDPNEVPVGKVGIILDEDNIEKIRPILELMALEKSQVLFQTPNGYVQLQVRDITYLEAYGDDIYLHGDEITNQVIKQPLYQLEEILKPYHFVRISKSYIVNISKIRYIRSGFNAKLDIELITGDHLEVSRSFVKDFKNALGIQKKED
jgi:DNA-binding LytR/AlgR family response regulator